MTTGPLATEKQVAFVAKLGGDVQHAQMMTVGAASNYIDTLLAENKDKMAAAKAEKMKMVPGAPKGFATVEGKVISVKTVENPYYGTQHKFLVEMDDGNRFYGTIPAAIRKSVGYDNMKLVGARVKVAATFKRGDEDPHFAVFSRPKGEVVQYAQQEVAA